METEPDELRVGPDEHRLRLDRYLYRVRPEASRRRVEGWLRTGRVLVNGRPQGPGYFVKRGDRVRVASAEGPPPQITGGRMPEGPAGPPAAHSSVPRVLLRRPELVAVGKPPGMPTVPAPDDLLAWVAREIARTADSGAGHPPGVVHRLDRDTSGVVLFSLSPRAHELLVRAFRRRSVAKTYLAIAAGRVSPGEGLIDLPLARDAGGAMRPTQAGLPARTSYRVLRACRDWSLLRVEPLTGRMHQIRAHLAAIGHPVLGDPTYGRPARGPAPPPRLWLHAWEIALPAPVREALQAPAPIVCPLWADLADHLEVLAPGLALEPAVPIRQLREIIVDRRPRCR